MYEKKKEGLKQTGRFRIGGGNSRFAHKITAYVLILCMMFTTVPMNVFAVEGGHTGICEHHTSHTDKCGYIEAVEGQPCGHQHTAGCYTDELSCGLVDDEDSVASDSNGVHTHTQECYALDCPHDGGEHDKACGYVEAVRGKACGYVCEICSKGQEKCSCSVLCTADAVDTGCPVCGKEIADLAACRGEKKAPDPDPGKETYTVTGFDELDTAVQSQTVPIGTAEDDLNLPDTLEATGYIAVEDTQPAPDTLVIKQVCWASNPIYDGEAAGTCFFTAVLPDGYTVEDGVRLPVITVTVEAEQTALEKVIAMIDALPTVDEIYANAVGDSEDGYDEWLAGMQETVGEINGAKAAYDALSDGDKEAVGEERNGKLAALVSLAARLPQAKTLSTPSYWSDEGVRATEFAGGDGNSSENAYQIFTAEQLGYMAYLINNEGSTYKAKHYKLMANINLNGHQWMPMGSGSDAFMGTFDGGEHTITNMNIAVNGNTSKDRFAGLFGKISGGTVKDVTLGDTCEINAYYGNYISPTGFAAIVGHMSGNSVVENCHSAAGVKGAAPNGTAYVGGVVGYAEKGIIRNCSNSGTVTGGVDAEAGGIVGIIGYKYETTVINCSNTGDIEIEGADYWSYAGGIVGDVYGNAGSVINCYNSGDISGSGNSSAFGGIAGTNGGTIINCYTSGTISASGSNRRDGIYVGNNKGTINNGYYLDNNNSGLAAIGYGSGSDVLSFDNTGTFTESSSVTIGSQLYSSLLPALNAWVTAQSGSYWFWTGDAAAPTLTKDAPPATYAVTVNVNKDNVNWPDHGKVFKLVHGDTIVTNLSSVESGTYDVYEGDTDTGVDVTVSNAAESVTVDYYTVTFYDGSTAYTSGTPQAPQIVLKNGKATGPADPTKANFIFNKWVTQDGGNTEFDFTNATITAAASVYASWTSDPSTAVTVTLSTDKNAPYYNGSSLTLTANVTMQSTGAMVETGTVQFYKGNEMLGNKVSYTNEGDASGFCLTVVCGTSDNFPFLEVGDNKVKAVYTPASSAITTESNTVTLNVSDKKDGNQYLGSTQSSTTYNGSTEGNCVAQFNITNNGGDQQITARQLVISGQKNNQAFSDFSVTYNDANTVASVYVKKPGTYTFTATLNNHSYVAEETATGTVSPAPLVITPNDLTIAVGETPEFSYTSNGLKGEDKITNITYITTANGNYSQAGQYDISIGDITMDNADCYTIEKKTAKLTVKVHTTITASAGAGGTISPSGIVSVSGGESQSFTISANSGYHIDSVIVDGVNQGAVGTYTFSNVTENHTISAAFSRNSSGGGGGGGGSSSSSSSPATTTTSTTTTEDGGQVTTSVTTDPTTGQTVTTEVKKDAAGNITGAQASVGTSGTSTSVTNGQAQISTAVDGNLVNQAVNAAGSPIPVGISVVLPNQELAALFNNPEVQNVTVNLTIPDTVTDNGKMTVNNITIDKATIEAAKAAGKDLAVTVKDEKSNINYVWTINGQELKASTAPVTDINLALIITPVKKLSGEKESIKAVVAGINAELKGLNLHFSHTGTLPSVIRVRIPSGNEAGISLGDVVYLYYYNPVSKSLEALSGNQYTVEADGFITISLTHCSDYVLLPKKVEVPQVKQGGNQVHTIKKGDTLNTISQQYGCTVADIMALNPGLDIYDLRVGSGLIIPGKQ